MGSLSEGFRAGMETGGRFSGIGAGLKEVLKNIQQENRLGSYERMETTQQVGQTQRKMIGEGYTPTEGGWQAPSGVLPEEMEGLYSIHGNKPYRIGALPREYLPGEREAYGAAYSQYLNESLPVVIKNLRRSGQYALADALSAKAATQQGNLAANLLGVEATDYPEQEGGTNTGGVWGAVKRGASNMLSGVTSLYGD